jgi:hypothetical protein
MKAGGYVLYDGYAWEVETYGDGVCIKRYARYSPNSLVHKWVSESDYIPITKEVADVIRGAYESG